jgi:hypothetical protein
LSRDESFLRLADDDAQVAHRHTRVGQLAWEELAARQVLARLDELQGIDTGWAAAAEQQRQRLMPRLDTNPMRKVEQILRAGDEAG